MVANQEWFAGLVQQFIILGLNELGSFVLTFLSFFSDLCDICAIISSWKQLFLCKSLTKSLIKLGPKSATKGNPYKLISVLICTHFVQYSCDYWARLIWWINFLHFINFYYSPHYFAHFVQLLSFC